ncbi:hypothetical protein FFT09_15830 [Saccharomonospora piscinae]|uniref:sensor histidine kinase n=1 Tax=Saccharomonospora piscinae TaxID=687388 RepID=UPI00110621C6|nr:ATP-binding protein [Saccharomonospora piscinae]TLW92320.1 hypothetical protein FFT09_15830 [Saccharomonospora piscinae]
MKRGDSGDVTEQEVLRRGRRYATVVRAAVLTCVTPVAAHQAPAATELLALAVAATLAAWSAIAVWRGPRRWVVVTDVAVLLVLCLAQRWLVVPELVGDNANWVIATVAITVVAQQWYLNQGARLLVTLAVLGACLAGNVVAAPSALPNAVTLVAWSTAEAVLSWGLFLVVRAGARAADRELTGGERARRRAAVAAARRTDEQEYLAMLHDTAAATLLAAGTAGQPDRWIREQAARDLAVLRDQGRTPATRPDHEDLVPSLRAVLGEAMVDAELTSPAHVTMPAAQAEAIRRATSEALANVAGHAGVTTASVTVSQVDGVTTVEVIDRGRGFVPARVAPHSRGVAYSIVRRMELVGGQGTVASAPGRGTQVTLRWPGE